MCVNVCVVIYTSIYTRYLKNTNTHDYGEFSQYAFARTHDYVCVRRGARASGLLSGYNRTRLGWWACRARTRRWFTVNTRTHTHAAERPRALPVASYRFMCLFDVLCLRKRAYIIVCITLTYTHIQHLINAYARIQTHSQTYADLAISHNGRNSLELDLPFPRETLPLGYRM